jgi:hypothetical protein
MKKIVLSAIVAATLVSSLQAAEVTLDGNFGVSSNYMWRGMSQTAGYSPMVNGGVDASYEGAYVGTWFGNVDGTTIYKNPNSAGKGMEMDLYAGYGGEAAGISYDLGYLQFNYVGAEETNNWGEAYVSVSKSLGDVDLGVLFYKGITGGTKLFGVEGSVGYKAISLTLGNYEKTGNYWNLGVTKSANGVDYTMGYSGIKAENKANNDSAFYVSATTSFSLLD